MSYLNAPWNWAYGFILVPPIIRDFCYRLVAENRYRMFGKKSDGACPYNPGLRKKCIDWGEECDLEAEEDNAEDFYASKDV
eukprot:TRINITY_DN827_c0_g2_i1.p1 TRINITY_DN827_c0_g2~~TRINITY_DN827_c0_g2_i1.p1  ORF type:complete len:81 (+),score=16.98 TRINITY_DN827_c0_g2_i1:3-245(+)